MRRLADVPYVYVMLGCMAVVALIRGCSLDVHMWGRYYHGQEPDTTLMETTHAERQEDVFGLDSSGAADPGTDVIPKLRD